MANVQTSIDNLEFLDRGRTEEDVSAAIAESVSGTDQEIREIGNILYEPGDTGKEYKTWYTGVDGSGNETIHYAYSSDGLSWTKSPSNPVAGGGSDPNLEDPYVVKSGGTYYMFCENKAVTDTIMRLTSSDGENWTLEGNINLTSCSSPVVWIEGETWHMIYEDMTGLKNIHRATSTDGAGSNWTDASLVNPIVTSDNIAWGSADLVPDDIIIRNGIYFLFMHRAGPGASNDTATGIFTSTDKNRWTNQTLNPYHPLGASSSDDYSKHVQPYQIGGQDYFLYYTEVSGGISVGFPVYAEQSAEDNMALTEIYVDPSIAADSGAGTVGDPYGDLEYAIEQETFDTTNGTRVNIKAGTAEVLAAQLDTALADTGTSVAWAPSSTAPLVFQGYTSAAGDGGMGEISGGDGGFSIIDTGRDYIHFRDLKMGNVGAAPALNLDRYSSIVNCWIYSTNQDGIRISIEGIVKNNYIVTDGSFSYSGIAAEGDTVLVENNYIDCTAGANGVSLRGGVVIGNIITRSGGSGAGDGIALTGHAIVRNNSIYSQGAADTGAGIDVQTGSVGSIIANNIIEGFDGTGGAGVASAAGTIIDELTNNSYADCETNQDLSGDVIYSAGNESLVSSAFTDPDNDDFSPKDLGDVKEGGYPTVIGGGYV